MKSTELRIGNYVYNETIREVMEVYPFMIPQIRRCELAGEHNIKPILLTEEWLFDFGFFKCQGRHGEYFKHKTQGLFRVWHDPHTQSWAIGRKDLDRFDEKYNTCFIRNGVKAVHLFQNIFHCLTDEELTLDKRNPFKYPIKPIQNR